MGATPISVCIAAKDAGRTIGEAILSAIEQPGDIEVVVVDDGSTDDTAGIAASFGDRVTVERQETRGHGAARNRAARLARGHYFVFLDADDVLVTGGVTELAAVLDADPSLDIAFGTMVEFADDDAPGRAPVVEPVGARLPTTCVMSADVFRRVGPFDEQLLRPGVEWIARSRARGARAIDVPVLVLRRRLHEGSMGASVAADPSHLLHAVHAVLRDRRG
jgi:glycosyltransferase involved in cell wall biosynthesis